MKAIRFTQDQADAHQARVSRRNIRAALPLADPVKRAKHGNVKVTVDGMKFDSKRELRCYEILRHREAVGEVRNIRHHVRFSLFAPGGEHYGIYKADFVFEALESAPKVWTRIVADAKSEWTRKLPAWQKVKLMMRACHNIEVIEL